MTTERVLIALCSLLLVASIAAGVAAMREHRRADLARRAASAAVACGVGVSAEPPSEGKFYAVQDCIRTALGIDGW